MAGCGRFPRGLLYTDYIEPLCQDARGTRLGNTTTSGATKGVEVPLVRVNLSAEWDTRAIGEIARLQGLSTIYGCDIRREFYLLGLWRRDEVIVYGE